MAATVDAVILGQGLAGTALAWSLLWDGARIVVIDRETRIGSSGVAAGLVTPITGQKLTRSWRFSDFWPRALAFYRRVETETNASVFREIRMVRLFAGSNESELFIGRRESHEFAGLECASEAALDERAFDVSHGGFEMSPAGQLDVPRYLDISREEFHQRDSYRTSDLDVSRDVEIGPSGVYLPKLGLRASRLILCQGFESRPNNWFRDVCFKAAKGEILTLRIPGMSEERVVHRGVWLAPIGNGFYNAGATYHWTQLDSLPTNAGRAEILERLSTFLRLPFEVVAHAAAVRPIHQNQFPVIGLHPVHSQLGYFNGLGSKGVLHAPFIADQFVAYLRGRGEIDADFDLTQKTTWSVGPKSPAAVSPKSVWHVKQRASRPLTELAQLAVSEVLRPGDIAIDATTGNGFDTHFLAKHVGPNGSVYAFDIQRSALEKTHARLVEAGLRNVTLLNQTHATMASSIPDNQRGQVAAVMFNLGYLPSGDKSLTTQPESTRLAIEQAISVLRVGGILTIVAYMGHEGGNAEADVVHAAIHELEPTQFETKTIESQPGKKIGPRLFLVKRMA